MRRLCLVCNGIFRDALGMVRLASWDENAVESEIMPTAEPNDEMGSPAGSEPVEDADENDVIKLGYD